MTRFNLLLFFFSFLLNGYSQRLTSCSSCNTVKYNTSNIANNKLHELQILRNEIFARHHYRFENDRLNEYFSRFAWYNTSKSTKSVHLNTIEKHNVSLFKQKEDQIKQHRKQLISELKKFKKAVNTNNHDFIASVFQPFFSKKDPMYNSLLAAISRVLNSCDLNDINWFKNQAQYSIKIDNGFSISTMGIYIKDNTITIITSNPGSHSSLMDKNNDEAFTYPSDYYSESEHSSGGEFVFKNGKLTLVNPLFAG